MKEETKNIIQELEALSPFLLSIRGKGSGFVIPENYFERLSENIEDSLHDYVILPSFLKEKILEGFAIPNHYFDSLSSEIEDNVYDASILPSTLQNVEAEGYVIPDNYFDELPEEIIARIEVENALDDDEKKEGFGVPKGYFDSLSDELVDRIKEEQKTLDESNDSKVIELDPQNNSKPSLLKRLRPLISVAAIGLLLVLGIQLFGGNDAGTINLDSDDAYAYLLEEDLVVDETVLENYTDEEVEEMLAPLTDESIELNLDDIELEDLDLDDLDF
ncbi:MAG: hypothetical protein AAGK97_02525 [Bacteroidota bacterium]